MPDYGQLAAEQLSHTVPVVAPPYPPPPWPLPGARLLKVTYETEKEVPLRWLPPAWGGPSPLTPTSWWATTPTALSAPSPWRCRPWAVAPASWCGPTACRP
jgi:hypothetical protein